LKSNIEHYPLVTVFTLIYNTNPLFNIEAIKSIRSNNYPNIQHIVIDDCSPNTASKRVVKEWIENEQYQCEFYEHDVNYGLCKTLNHVLSLAKGEYIFGCSDDVIVTNRIQTQITEFEKLGKNYAFIFSDMSIINNNNDLISDSYINANGITESEILELESLSSINQIRYILITKNILMAPTITYSVEALRKIGGFDERLYFEDLDIHTRLILHGYKFKFYNHILAKYRKSDDSMSQSVNLNYLISHNLIYKNFIGINNSFDKDLIQRIKSTTLELSQFGFQTEVMYWFKFIIIREFDLKYVFKFLRRLIQKNIIKWKGSI
jgi:GT2 family glycosyltransferase